MGDLPILGPLPGTVNLMPGMDNLTPAGTPRPFAPGEYVQNPNGSWSSEITTTMPMPNGKYSNIPTLWLIDGKPVRVSEDQAVDYAVNSGLNWNSYDSEDAANKASEEREQNWQKVTPQTAGTVAPLWSSSRRNFLENQVNSLPQK